jgi:tetratricopeptide (TPR) repeat protein
LNEAIRLNPVDHEAFRFRGFAFEKTGDLVKALEDYSKAVALSPSDLHARRFRAKFLANQGKFKDAIKDYDALQELKLFGQADQLERGRLRLEAQEAVLAVSDLDAVIKSDLKHSEAYVLRGLARCQLREWDKAKGDFDLAVKSDPENAAAYGKRGMFFAACPDDKMRDGKQALEDAKKACKLTKWKGFEEIESLAAAYAETGDFASATKWQSHALLSGGLNSRPTRDPELQPALERVKLYKTKTPFRLK